MVFRTEKYGLMRPAQDGEERGGVDRKSNV